jgi:hypothetical protein
VQDIDQILERAKVVTHADDGQKSSSFSKASFICADNSSSVDIDDPDFWKKAIGLTELEKEGNDDDDPELPRKRRRVQRFVENFSSSINGMEWDPTAAEMEPEKVGCIVAVFVILLLHLASLQFLHS